VFRLPIVQKICYKVRTTILEHSVQCQRLIIPAGNASPLLSLLVSTAKLASSVPSQPLTFSPIPIVNHATVLNPPPPNSYVALSQLPTEYGSYRPSSPLKSKRKLTYQKNVSAEDSTLPPKWQNSNKTQQPSSIPNSALLKSSIASTHHKTHNKPSTPPNP